MRRRTLSLALALPLLAAACATPPAGQLREVVFFTADSAALDPEARTVITRAAAAARRGTNTPVRVRGYAAPDTGTSAFNRVLAQTRAQAVADGLVAAGLPGGQVSMEALGAVPFTATPTESRRVEILIGS